MCKIGEVLTIELRSPQAIADRLAELTQYKIPANTTATAPLPPPPKPNPILKMDAILGDHKLLPKEPPALAASSMTNSDVIIQREAENPILKRLPARNNVADRSAESTRGGVLYCLSALGASPCPNSLDAELS